MKNGQHITFCWLICVLIITSCNIQKRKYSKGFYFSKSINAIATTKYNAEKDISIKFLPVTKIDTLELGEEHKEVQDKGLEFVQSEIQPMNDSLCDVIVFKDLKETKCIIREINPETIRYTKCGFENGPLVTIRKDKVSSIIYRNGESESFSTEQDLDLNTANKTDAPPKKIEPFGVVALLIGVGAWLLPVELLVVAALVIGLSIIFGFVSLSRYTKEPEKYHGKFFPILSLIAGLISVIALSYWII
jgi:hypothetical protein